MRKKAVRASAVLALALLALTPARAAVPDGAPSEPGQVQAAPSTASEIQELRGRISGLESMGDAMGNLSKSALEQMSLVFGISAAFFGSFFVFFGVRQVLVDRGERKTTAKYDEMTRQFQESSRASIHQVTNLIRSLDSLFQLRQTAEALQQQIVEVREGQAGKEKQEAVALRQQAQALNKDALNVCKTLNRDNYKAGYHQEVIRDLSRKLEAWPDKRQLSGNCMLLIALDRIVRNMLREALTALDAAATISTAHANDLSRVDVELFYPGVDPGEIKASVMKQANIDFFHQAIVRYNLGEHSRAVESFRSAITHGERDVQSIGYIPESMFLGRQHDFAEVMRSFEQTEAQIVGMEESARWPWRVPKRSHLSLLRVKWGNCYFPGCRHEPYRRHESLRSAETHYQKALDHDEGSYVAKFSYAQALALKAGRDIGPAERAQAKQRSQQLFREVFDVLKIRVGEVTEPKIQMTLYYMLAITIKEGDIQAADPRASILDIYERGGRLPPIREFRIFSPLSKNDLTYPEFKLELQEFESRI